MHSYTKLFSSLSFTIKLFLRHCLIIFFLILAHLFKSRTVNSSEMYTLASFNNCSIESQTFHSNAFAHLPFSFWTSQLLLFFLKLQDCRNRVLKSKPISDVAYLILIMREKSFNYNP